MEGQAKSQQVKDRRLFQKIGDAESHRRGKRLLSKASHNQLVELAKTLYNVNGNERVNEELSPEEREKLKTLQFRRQINLYNKNLKSVKKIRELKKSPLKLQKVLYTLVPLIQFLSRVVDRVISQHTVS
jgi:benzoyl-CoA reductase/2-hydroxyglutaryl-CoA dehydratase subunit BcrC/BadD/HgdB